jgi:tetratricopeptide (TPR) repeat protein
MKTHERRHLKENDLAHGLTVALDYLAPRGKQIAMILGGVAVLVVVVLAGYAISQRSNTKADMALAEAMVALNARVVPSSDAAEADLPAAATLGATGTFATERAKLNVAIPKLQSVADAFPDDEAGIVARYHLAGALGSVGRNDEAVKEFSAVIAKAPKDNVYGRMARLGLAEAQTRAGQIDAAITSWKALADENSGDLPADAILLELARAYVAKGDAAEARKVFTQLIDQHPTSPYSGDAKTELEGLKG